jgi:hypothetical protein
MMSTHGIGPRLIPQLSDADALAICAATERDPTSARAGRAVAFLHGLRQGLRGKQGVVGELSCSLGIGL